MKKTKIIIGLLIVFILGGLSGALGTGMFIRHKVDQFVKGEHPPIKHILMKRIVHDLDLSHEQREKVSEILEKMQQKLHELRQKHHPELEKIFSQGIEQIKAHLDKEQQLQLDKIYEDIKKHKRPIRRFNGEGRRPHFNGETTKE